MTNRVQGFGPQGWKQHTPGSDVLDWKNSVKAATTVALPANTLDGPTNTLTADADGAFPAVDGVAILVGDSILVKNEGGGTSPKNGIYVLTDAGSGGSPWILTRRDDANTDAKVTAGMAVSPSEGTQADTAWMLATNDPIVLNTTPLTFVVFSANPLCDALPVAIIAGAVGAAGVSAEVSRCDHEHAVAVASPVEISDTTNAPGVAGTLIRSDHVHAHGSRGGGSLHALVTIVTAGFMSAADKTKLDGIQPNAAAVCSDVPSGLSAGSAGAAGTDADAARCDHEHPVPVAAPAGLAVGDAGGAGASTSLVRADHEHAVPAAAPAGLAVGDAGGAGASTDFNRADHEHAVPAAAPAALGVGDAGGPGASTDFNRADHEHAVAAGVPVATGIANAAGASGAFVRADHVHETGLVIQDEGVGAGTAHTTNFVGAGVTAAVALGVATVTIPGGGAAVAPSLGGMSCDNTAATVATVIPGVGVFVPVGTGAPGHPIYVVDAFSPGFAISGGAPTDTQTLDYTAAPAQRVVINATVNASSGVLGGVVLGVRILQNGVPIGPVLKGQSAGLFFSSVTVTGEIHTTVAIGDTFQIEVANFTNGTSVVVEYAQLSIEGTVG